MGKECTATVNRDLWSRFSNRASSVLGRRVAFPFRDDRTLNLFLVQSGANLPEPRTTLATAEWNY